MAQEQNFKNHARFDPIFHGFLFIVGLFLLAACGYAVYRDASWGNIVRLVGMIWALVLMFVVRIYALKVQDRVIRLEERLRLSELLQDPLRGRVGELTERQLIALRFASDAEVPALTGQALASGLAPKTIKQSIKVWRPDYWRV